MQLINKTDLLPPGVCILCEGSPSDGEKIVDTLKTLVTGFPFKLEGRKYVCESCITAVAGAIGLISDTAAQEAARKQADAEAKLAVISGFLHGLSEEIRSGKVEQIVATAEPVPAEDVKSGLEAAVEAGTDPGADSLAGAAPAESDAQPVTAAETETAHAEAAPPTFDPSLTEKKKKS